MAQKLTVYSLSCTHSIEHLCTHVATTTLQSLQQEGRSCRQELYVGTNKDITTAQKTRATQPTFSFPSPLHHSASAPLLPALVSFARSVCCRNLTLNQSRGSGVCPCDVVFFRPHSRSCTSETCSCFFVESRWILWAFFRPVCRDTKWVNP